MAVEITNAHDVSIPTRDFSIPSDEDMRAGIKTASRALLDGRDVFVGCMGGIGRTGLFLGVLTAVERPDVPHPVQHVRQHYMLHAIETKEQEQFVSGFVRRNPWFTRMLRAKRHMTLFKRFIFGVSK